MNRHLQYPIDYHCGVRFKHDPHYWDADGYDIPGQPGYDCDGGKDSDYFVAYGFLVMILLAMVIVGAVQY